MQDSTASAFRGCDQKTPSAPPRWHYVQCGDPAVRSYMSPKLWAHNPCGIFDATKASMGPHFPRSASGGLFSARPCQNKHLHTQFKHEDALIFALRGRRKLVCVPSTFETIQSVLYIQEFTVHLNVKLISIIVILDSITISCYYLSSNSINTYCYNELFTESYWIRLNASLSLTT